MPADKLASINAAFNQPVVVRRSAFACTTSFLTSIACDGFRRFGVAPLIANIVISLRRSRNWQFSKRPL